MSIMCLFSLSAILALLLIAIYIPQRFYAGKRTHPDGPQVADLGC